MNIIKANNKNINYFSFGSGKRIFVIIPGISLVPISEFENSIIGRYKQWSNLFTFYCFDRTVNSEAGYSTLDMSNDIAAALEELKIKDAIIYGVSQGAMIAQVLSATHPELVSKLIMSSTLVKQNFTSKNTFKKWIKLSYKNNVKNLIKFTFKKIYSKRYLLKNNEVYTSLYEKSTGENVEKFRYLAEACFSYDGREYIKKIKCPTFVLGAGKDKVLGVSGTYQICKQLKCNVFVYKKGSHAIYDEEPDFLSRIFEFASK